MLQRNTCKWVEVNGQQNIGTVLIAIDPKDFLKDNFARQKKCAKLAKMHK